MTHLTRTSLLLAGFFALDKVFAFARQILIARLFGLSQELDAFNTANNLPDLLYALISGGALAIAFIPVLSESLAKSGRPAAWELFSRIANLAFLVTAGVSVVVAFLAEPLVGWELGIAPGFNASQQSLVADLMRLNLIATLIFSISGLVMAGLQANQHFLLPALAPILYNVGQIFGAAVLAPEQGMQLGPVSLPAFGMGIYGVVYGVLIGAGLHLAIQVPVLFRYQFRWKPAIGLTRPDVQQVLRLLGPRLLTMLFIQITFIARDNMASRLGEGAVTALSFGWMIMQVPETLIGTAIGTALLPTLSELAAQNERERFRETLERVLRVLLALTIPAAVLLAIAVGPLIRAAFGLGGAENELVTWVTRMFLFGIVGHSVLEVAARAFYSQQDARRPLFASALTTLAYAALGVLLLPSMGAAGLSLANTLAYTAEAALLLVWLRPRLAGPFRLQGTPWRTALGTLIGGGITALALRILPGSSPEPGAVIAAVALAAGGLIALPFIRNELRVLIRL